MNFLNVIFRSCIFQLLCFNAYVSGETFDQSVKRWSLEMSAALKQHATISTKRFFHSKVLSVGKSSTFRCIAYQLSGETSPGIWLIEFAINSGFAPGSRLPYVLCVQWFKGRRVYVRISELFLTVLVKRGSLCKSHIFSITTSSPSQTLTNL